VRGAGGRTGGDVLGGREAVAAADEAPQAVRLYHCNFGAAPVRPPAGAAWRQAPRACPLHAACLTSMAARVAAQGLLTAMHLAALTRPGCASGHSNAGRAWADRRRPAQTFTTWTRTACRASARARSCCCCRRCSRARPAGASCRSCATASPTRPRTCARRTSCSASWVGRARRCGTSTPSGACRACGHSGAGTGVGRTGGACVWAAVCRSGPGARRQQNAGRVVAGQAPSTRWLEHERSAAQGQPGQRRARRKRGGGALAQRAGAHRRVPRRRQRCGRAPAPLRASSGWPAAPLRAFAQCHAFPVAR